MLHQIRSYKKNLYIWRLIRPAMICRHPKNNFTTPLLTREYSHHNQFSHHHNQKIRYRWLETFTVWCLKCSSTVLTILLLVSSFFLVDYRNTPSSGLFLLTVCNMGSKISAENVKISINNNNWLLTIPLFRLSY